MSAARTAKLNARAPLLGAALLALVACSENATPTAPPEAATRDLRVVGRSWDVCAWLGPDTHRPGIFGSDLGFSVELPRDPEQLQLLFGDTWAEPRDACQYPLLKSDDFAAQIPRQRPAALTPGPPPAASGACDGLRYTLEDDADPTSWRRLRLFPDAIDHSPDRALDTSMLRTPLTAWSDGQHSFAIFFRDEWARCDVDADCPDDLRCSHDPAHAAQRLGGCQPQLALAADASPALCRADTDCPAPALCAALSRGVCFAPEPFQVSRAGQLLAPLWNERDPRNGVAAVLHVASAFWPERPEDYASGARFVTSKLVNVTARAVAHFDPDDPEQSDYGPGHETLLLWGRARFFGQGGFQALPFFAYLPLAGLMDAEGKIRWSPRYFAGYQPSGAPAWSGRERDAAPIYGVDETTLVEREGQWVWQWSAPELDYVNQMSMLWLAPLRRWVMLYGGESPAQSDPRTGKRPAPTYLPPLPGAVQLRSAAHPFGRARATDPRELGFGAPRAVLPRASVAKHLACDPDDRSARDCTPDVHQQPGDLLATAWRLSQTGTVPDSLTVSAACVAGTLALDAQYSVGGDSAGHFYGAAIIEPWTQDVTGRVPDLPPDEPAVELYWNVSTWNPYQVLLIKTQLRARELLEEQDAPEGSAALGGEWRPW